MSLTAYQLLTEAEQESQKTIELLDRDGYCLWRCRTLGGEIIMLLDDENGRLLPAPSGYPVYFLNEPFEELPERTLRLINRVKKSVPSRITMVRQPTEAEKEAHKKWVEDKLNVIN